MVKMPEIGDVITVDWGLALCQELGLDYLVERLMNHPERYKPFKFDGVSGINDKFLGVLNGGKWHLFTQIALPHDLAFAYGTLGREDEEKQEAEWKVANDRFERECVTIALASPDDAAFARQLVERGGREELHLPWSWGFAHVGVIRENWEMVESLWATSS